MGAPLQDLKATAARQPFNLIADGPLHLGGHGSWVVKGYESLHAGVRDVRHVAKASEHITNKFVGKDFGTNVLLDLYQVGRTTRTKKCIAER